MKGGRDGSTPVLTHIKQPCLFLKSNPGHRMLWQLQTQEGHKATSLQH
jgi:predicted secreted protein